MNLLALMYHRAQAGQHGNPPEMLDEHFAHIARHHTCVLPGEVGSADGLNVCITFDDAYFDFYDVAYPLLQKHRLRALLAVPPVVVRELAYESPALRMLAQASVDYDRPNYDGFCTWSELREMASSGLVAIAAHGFTHCPLDREVADLHTEVALPKVLLEGRLQQPVNSFVFPYGRFNQSSLKSVQRHYRHAFRIGGGDNEGWDGLLYRVDADMMFAPDEHFTRTRRVAYRARRIWNRIRGR